MILKLIAGECAGIYGLYLIITKDEEDLYRYINGWGLLLVGLIVLASV